MITGRVMVLNEKGYLIYKGKEWTIHSSIQDRFEPFVGKKVRIEIIANPNGCYIYWGKFVGILCCYDKYILWADKYSKDLFYICSNLTHLARGKKKRLRKGRSYDLIIKEVKEK